MSSIALTMYTGGEKYLDTAAPYTIATILIKVAAISTNLKSDVVGMTDFTGQCNSATCIPSLTPSPQSPPLPLCPPSQFFKKPLD